MASPAHSSTPKTTIDQNSPTAHEWYVLLHGPLDPCDKVTEKLGLS